MPREWRLSQVEDELHALVLCRTHPRSGWGCAQRSGMLCLPSSGTRIRSTCCEPSFMTNEWLFSYGKIHVLCQHLLLDTYVCASTLLIFPTPAYSGLIVDGVLVRASSRPFFILPFCWVSWDGWWVVLLGSYGTGKLLGGSNWHNGSSQRAKSEVAVAHVFFPV